MWRLMKTILRLLAVASTTVVADDAQAYRRQNSGTDGFKWRMIANDFIKHPSSDGRSHKDYADPTLFGAEMG